jgi:hypothetical protein
MKPALLLTAWCVSISICGCDLPPDAPIKNESPPVTESRSVTPREETSSRQRSTAEVSFDTARDERFAEFVAKAAGDMVRKVAVGIERRGVARVQLGKNTAPEDTLPLTKSLMAGARKDFPGKRITLSIFDPDGQPILKAHYHPDHGVRYQVAHSDTANSRATSPAGQSSDEQAPSAANWNSDNAQSGSTNRDRQFAEWAFNKGHKYLRYVQADLERNGRLWFGVTRDVKPDDVSALTKSILQGARTEFPRRTLTAKVFDPEGEAIGNATLGADGEIHWTRVASR